MWAEEQQQRKCCCSDVTWELDAAVEQQQQLQHHPAVVVGTEAAAAAAVAALAQGVYSWLCGRQQLPHHHHCCHYCHCCRRCCCCRSHYRCLRHRCRISGPVSGPFPLPRRKVVVVVGSPPQPDQQRPLCSSDRGTAWKDGHLARWSLRPNASSTHSPGIIGMF